MFVGGGVAMALAYDATRVTRDVDARFVPHGIVLDEAASPEHVFAMKALAARTRDIEDLRLLAGMAGVRSSADALGICAEFFPDEPVSQRSTAVLRELFD